jgi:hypothetical protein
MNAAIRTVIVSGAIVIAVLVGWALPRLDGVATDISPLNGRDFNATLTRPRIARTLETRRVEPLKSYDEIEQRMLFSSTRRKPSSAPSTSAPRAAVATPPTIDFGQYQLLGILLHPGHKRALIRTPTTPEGRWVAEGGSLDGVLIRTINADQVTLEADGITGNKKVKR